MDNAHNAGNAVEPSTVPRMVHTGFRLDPAILTAVDGIVARFRVGCMKPTRAQVVRQALQLGLRQLGEIVSALDVAAVEEAAPEAAPEAPAEEHGQAGEDLAP